MQKTLLISTLSACAGRALSLCLVGLCLWPTLAEAQRRSSRATQGHLYHAQASYLSQSLPTGDGYAAFIKQRYGVDRLDLHGSRLALGYQFQSKWQLEGALESVDHTFRYRNLNGNRQSGRLALQQTQFLIRYAVANPLWLGAGLGFNSLLRELDDSYRDEDIIVENVDANAGKQSSTSNGQSLSMELRGLWYVGALGFTTGLRYLSSTHNIPLDDKRPALNAAGTPKASTFDLSGWSYDLGLAIGFGSAR